MANSYQINQDESFNPVRVGLLLPSLLFGGAERWSLNLARHCNPFKVVWSGCVVAHKPWVEPPFLYMMAALMPVYHDGRIWQNGKSHTATLGDAIALLWKDADVIVTWEVDEVMRMILDRLRVKVVNVAHRYDPESLEPFVGKFDYLATVWEQNRNAFGDSFFSRVCVIPNGIDLNRCVPVENREVTRKAWGFKPSELVVGYIGRIHPQKNYTAMARALRGLGHNARGVVVGTLCKEAQDAETTIQLIAPNQVHLLSPVEDIGSVLSAIDVFFHPSPQEVCSLSLLEAWAALVPVVAIQVGAVPDLEKEVGPLVVPIERYDNDKRLAHAVRYAFSNSSEIIAMCQRAADLVWSRFGVRRMAKNWTNYLLDLTKPSATLESSRNKGTISTQTK